MTTKTEREQFEAWAIKCTTLTLYRPEHSETYKFPSAEDAWQAWHARASQVAASPVQVQESDEVHGPFSTTEELMAALNTPDDECPCVVCAAPPTPPDEPLIDGYPLWSGIPQPVSQEPVAWATIPEAFNEWWDAYRLTQNNPFSEDSPAYWAWEGWCAKEATPQQAEQPEYSERDIADMLAIAHLNGMEQGKALLQPAEQAELSDERLKAIWQALGYKTKWSHYLAEYARSVLAAAKGEQS